MGTTIHGRARDRKGSGRRGGVTVAGLTLCLAAGVAAASDGFDWVTVGDPGNRATTRGEVFWPEFEGRGRVDTEFRIMRTLVTNEQHVEFLNAYEPFRAANPILFSTELTGFFITQGSDGVYRVRSDSGPRWAANPSVEMAMRFANWLHNGKASNAAAFETGAYDMSALVKDSTGRVLSDTVVRQEGARYWIPNIDEMFKAIYWDPAKDGVGGYRRHPNGSDDALVPGQPGEPGAERLDPATPFPGRVDVELFPDTMSPWGVRDVSGHVWQVTDELLPFGSIQRYTVGSGAWNTTYFDTDMLGFGAYVDIRLGSGIRFAAVVPSAGAAWLLALGGVVAARRRRSA